MSLASPASTRCLLGLFFVFLVAHTIEPTNGETQKTLLDEKSCGLRLSEHAFVFYGLHPSADVLNFALELSLSSPYDVYIVPDDEAFVWAEAAKYPTVHLTIVPKSAVLAANFSHASNLEFLFDTPRNESVWAMDRALTLAASDEFAEKYCRIWLIEDDVFIPSVAAAIHVDKLASGDYDLISTSYVFSHRDDRKWIMWPQFSDSLQRISIPTELWSHCMVNSIGLSPRYLKMLRNFASINGQLLFSEPMMPTFAAIWNLRHLKLHELHMLWRNNNDVNYSWQQVAAHKLWWFHPMKDEKLRKQYRTKLGTDQNSFRMNEPSAVSSEKDEVTFNWKTKLGYLGHK